MPKDNSKLLALTHGLKSSQIQIEKTRIDTGAGHHKFIKFCIAFLSLTSSFHLCLSVSTLTSNSIRSASTWHISAPILCMAFLSLSSPFHLRLALSGSILPYLFSHDRFLRILTILTKTPSLSPCRANVVPVQIQVRQRGIVLQTLCQCLTRDKDVQNTVKSSKIHRKSDKRNLNAFYRILLILPLILTYHVVSNEKNKLKFTLCMMDLAHLSTNLLCSLRFTHFTISPSISSVSVHTAVPLPPNDRFPRPEIVWLPNSFSCRCHF